MSARPEIPADSPLSTVGWRCSTCGGLIRRIEDGWVEWLACEEENDRATIRGMRLIHRRAASPIKNGCQYDAHEEFKKGRSIVEGLSLERFVGPDGLMLLLSLIASNEAAAGDVIELAKRVQIPGYEQARELFQPAIDHGLLSPSIGNGFYLQSEIYALLQWIPSIVRT